MIERKPIKIKRTPVKLPQDIKMQLKIAEMEDLTRDDDIIEIAEHYGMLVRKVLNISHFNAISLKNPQNHKNWIHFERVYEVCRMKKWDAKLYIESQFVRAKSWKTKYPFTNTLYSVGALKFFTNYCSTIGQLYEKGADVEKRKRGKETQTIKEEILEQVIASVESISFYLGISNYSNPAEYKVSRIYQYWQELSPYYLWSIPWFHDVIRELPYETVESVLQVFTMINKSKTLQRLISEVVPQIEQHYGIPGNISLG